MKKVFVFTENSEMIEYFKNVPSEFCAKFSFAFDSIDLQNLQNIDLLNGERFDFCIIDFNYLLDNDAKIINVLSRKLGCNTKIVVLSSYKNSCFAVSCMKNGATEYIEFPCSYSAFFSRLEKLLPVENSSDDDIADMIGDSDIIGRSEIMKNFFRKVFDYAKSNEPILLLGEHGTGKTFIAKHIHDFSGREGEYRIFNSGTLRNDMALSELFGSVKGAFTGAENKPGLFEICNKGTLFLDEIGELSLGVQQMLLSVLSDNFFYRIGNPSNKINSDVRLITATNADLHALLKSGKLREDFLSRIKFHCERVPSLRERKDDIPFFVDAFLKNKNKGISQGALSKLMDYNWPSNIRGLNSVIAHAVYNAKNNDIIMPEHIEFSQFD